MCMRAVEIHTNIRDDKLALRPYGQVRYGAIGLSWVRLGQVKLGQVR